VPKKLIVNDNSDYVNRWQAFKWFSDGDVITVSLGSRKEFIAALNGLIKQGLVFDRVAFRTHGDNGSIWFGDDSVGPWGWVSLADEIKFPTLFPGPTKVYFDSCDTAVGEPGTKFLIKAGEMLLKAGGGSTSAWASRGLAIPGVVPFIGGHTIHTPNYDNLKTFYFKPGGILFEPPAPPPSNDIWNGTANAPGNIGNKI